MLDMIVVPVFIASVSVAIFISTLQLGERSAPTQR